VRQRQRVRCVRDQGAGVCCGVGLHHQPDALAEATEAREILFAECLSDSLETSSMMCQT
jgi:hypothetical protein